jgi:hypothetical protein
MSALSTASRTDLFSLFGNVQKEIGDLKTLEQAAQKTVDLISERFKDDLALARIYATVPYRTLPPTNKTWVDGLVKAKQISVQPETPVLSLVGTRGAKAQWNDRRKSEGHVGIPLASAAFVDGIPMIARLLSDLGFKAEWLDSWGASVGTVTGEWSGLFHVPDAKTAKDAKSRHIIPAQDFVAEQGVKTVFGVGGSYPSGGFFAMIFFTKADVAKPVAERFMPIISTFKIGTTKLAQAGTVFVG